MSVQKSFEELISLAIKREEEAYDFYMDSSKKSELSSSGKLLEDLAKQEVGHKEKLKEALGDGVCDTFTCTSVGEVEDLDLSKYLVDIPLDASSSPQDILVVAIKREEAATNFYKALSELTQHTAHRTVFETLAKEEQEHKDILQEMYDDIFQADN
ncbi:MAG: ferritin-like domain-containing protein [Candidatus Thorarchaeota archaeon]